MSAGSPPSFTPSPYEWTGQNLDGDILAGCAFFVFPVLAFYGSKQFRTSVTSASVLVVAYAAYLVRTPTPHTPQPRA